ncbi:hypothetical protein OOK41_27535 [Micromonospora sp. NBC_01655]|uniref:hypothetical protein n=1 Tax=unclassified Micromonospora TaxID=2617518 RepID=UPI000E42FF28|nr:MULTISPECIES: hypothetical protein [unclassified Micromonospora]MCX4474015.1 hypothetical protein [Micromonospora sp. NBC_01655]
MPLTVSLRELTNSYIRLRKAAETSPAPVGHLLRFYSVECGLKTWALKDRNARSTAQRQELITHDLRQLARSLNLSASAYRDLMACRRPPRGGFSHPPVEVRELHEAWRYGAELDPEDEVRAVAVLTTLGRLCEERIGR